MSIPKVIHYCWFGGNPKTEIIEKCIASWRKNCPDWEIKEWNEKRIGDDCCCFAYVRRSSEHHGIGSGGGTE